MSSNARLVSLGFCAEWVRQGAHIAYIYDDEQERRELMAQFIKSGLSETEFVWPIKIQQQRADA